MKVLREIYDFIAGGSVAGPAGAAVAIAVAALGHGRVAPAVLAGAFTAVVLLALGASALERP